MIHAHRMIDALRNKTGEHPPLSLCVQPDQIERFASLIETAEKFDFGPLVLEMAADGRRAAVPTFTNVEWELWEMNLVPLPAQVCWYEYQITDRRHGLLIFTDERYWYSACFELTPVACWDCVVVRAERQRTAAREVVSIWPSAYLAEFSDQEIQELHGSSWELSIYLTLMLGSKTTEKEWAAAPKLSNKLRLKKNKSPLPAHTIIRIVPWRYLNNAQVEAGRSHASPRLHWRRSHLRVYDHRTPASTFVETKGWCVAIPRCLVGSAALGEVSHEYFVEATP